jgi:hypothetical protein
MKKFLFLLFALLFLPRVTHTIPLDSTIARSDSCVAIEWTPDSFNTDNKWYTQYGTQCKNKDSIYKYCDFIAGHTYHGIAYSYGGEDPWYIFREHLATGYLAGSHQCHYNTVGDPSGKVTGTDCSGFLCFIWNISRTTTTDLYNNKAYPSIPIIEVECGDALVKASAAYGYHAILVVEASDPAEVVISEATSVVNGCRQRVVDLTTSEWAPYKAIRNPTFHKQQVVELNDKMFPEIKIAQSEGKFLTIYLNEPLSGVMRAYDVAGKLLLSQKLENTKTTYTITKITRVPRIILLSIQSGYQSRSLQIPLY